MNKNILYFLFLVIPSIVFAQFAVVSTQPANNTKNVPLQTTISITFNEAIDTMAMQHYQNLSNFASFDSVISHGYSSDLKTSYANVVLKPNQSYFVAFLIIKAASGAYITTPYVFHFTTGADFPPYSVSGTVLSGTTGVSAEGSIVALSSFNIMNGEGKEETSPFVGWTNVNSNGTYSVPYLPNGTYWPLAVKDVNHDGEIDPDNGIDVMAIADSIIINNASISNFNLTFINFSPMVFSESITIGDSLAKKFPADRVLRRISGWDMDTLGRARKWEYAYTYTAPVGGFLIGSGVTIRASESDTYILDQGYVDWIKQLKPVTNYKTAASSATVMANVEAAGGKKFRLQPHPDSLEFNIEFSMADQKYGWFGPQGFDTSKIYWAVAYTLNYQRTPNQTDWVDGRFYLCDQTTGAVLLTRTMGVKQNGILPEQFLLNQNYPNPFNPTTNISFTIESSNVTSLKIYDILGNEVAVLVNGKIDAGDYDIPFNASRLSSGIYFYQLRSGKFVETKKMILLK